MESGEPDIPQCEDIISLEDRSVQYATLDCGLSLIHISTGRRKRRLRHINGIVCSESMEDPFNIRGTILRR